MAGETKRSREEALAAENVGLRELLTQAGLDAARILEQAGIDATQNDTARRLQRLLLEEVHHRIKNMLTTVLAITSQSLRAAEDLTQGRLAIESRLMALGRTQDLLLQASWTNTKLTKLILTAVEPFDSDNVGRFIATERSTRPTNPGHSSFFLSPTLPMRSPITVLLTLQKALGASSIVVPAGGIAKTSCSV